MPIMSNRPCAARALAWLALALPVAAQNYAVAQMRGATPSGSGVTGTVTFEQAANAPLGDMTVTYSITGLRTDGPKGFHVHQYGDTRITDTLSTMAAHFVPMCVPPGVDKDGNSVGGCEDDQLHGFPPDQVRQPGDMGNITVVGGASSGTLTLGQQKMSLTDGLRSIVGRVVVVHSLVDNGKQPYGDAGAPMAYGVIGVGNPSKKGRTTNAALAPTTPKVDKIACTFEAASTAAGSTPAASVSGNALLTLQEPCDSGGCKARMQARLVGLKKGATHSFHFHTWGDMTVDWSVAGELGAIYKSHGVDVTKLEVLADDSAQYDVLFDTDTLLEHVGKSLTVHEGADSSSPTIAAAACGLANPTSTLDTTAAPQPQGMAVSGGVVALLVISVLLFLVFAVLGGLYYFRKPIPFCGACLYASDFLSVPPPPPRPQASSVGPPKSPPPPTGAV